MNIVTPKIQYITSYEKTKTKTTTGPPVIYCWFVYLH